MQKNNKIIAITHCQDHVRHIYGGDKLINSFKYFHPEIPIIRYGTKEQEEILKKYPGFRLYSFNPVLMLEAKKQYNADLVIFIDHDSIVLDRMDEVLAMDYDIASVKNDPDVHTENEDHNRPIKGIPNYEWVNAGFVACKNEHFLKQWYFLNFEAINYFGGINYYKMVEQDTLNIIFHNKLYKTKILDDNKYNCFYGPSSQYITKGREPAKSVKHYGAYFCESWLDIKLENGHPKLHNKDIKVIHHCHGGNKEKLKFDLFNPEFKEYLRKITGYEE